MSDHEAKRAEARALLAEGLSRRVVMERTGLARTTVDRIANGRPERERHRYRQRPGAKLSQEDYETTLERIAAELGVTRERVRQIESVALKKLASPAHLDVVRRRLVQAVADLRLLQREGATIEDEWRQAMVVHDLMGALEWLEAGAAGDLRTLLIEAESRGHAEYRPGLGRASELRMYAFGGKRRAA